MPHYTYRAPRVIPMSEAAREIVHTTLVDQMLEASALNQREGGNHVRQGVSFPLPAPRRRLSFIERLRRWLGL